MWIIPALLGLIFFYIFVKFRQDKLSSIPGPRGLPVLGNMHQLHPKAPYRTVSRWSKLYGDLFKYRVLHQNVVVVSSYEGISEVLHSTICASRPYSYRFSEILQNGWPDITGSAYSLNWNERKKALTRALNAYGTGKLKIEIVTMNCINDLVKMLHKKSRDGKQITDLRDLLYDCNVRIIMNLAYGRALSDEEKRELLIAEKSVLEIISANDITAIIDLFPPFQFLPFNKIKDKLKQVAKFGQWFIDHYDTEKHAEQGNESVMAYLKTFVNKFTGKKLEQMEILGMSLNLVSGGFMTTTASLYALILAFINHPEIQEKVHAEIENATEGREPSLDDRINCPFTCAVVEENLRHSTIAPLSAPHFTVDDIVIQGKLVPKDTLIFPNIWAMHHDERYFSHPCDFKPERYLDNNGKFLPSTHEVRKHTLAFSAGKRICPGEGLARSRMFLIIASLVQNFVFLPEDPNNIPPFGSHLFEGQSLIEPRPYSVKLRKRD